MSIGDHVQIDYLTKLTYQKSLAVSNSEPTSLVWRAHFGWISTSNLSFSNESILLNYEDMELSSSILELNSFLEALNFASRQVRSIELQKPAIGWETQLKHCHSNVCYRLISPGLIIWHVSISFFAARRWACSFCCAAISEMLLKLKDNAGKDPVQRWWSCHGHRHPLMSA